jgi:hypothetical protein
VAEINELAELDDSLRALVRKAYNMGRSDALKKVVNVLNEDGPREDRLALMAPDETTGVPGSVAPEARSEGPPWWAWRVR